MAVQTINAGLAPNATIVLSFDDSTMKFVSLSIVNNSSRNFYLEVQNPSVWTLLIQAGQNRNYNVPTLMQVTWQWRTVTMPDNSTRQDIDGLTWRVCFGV